MRALTIEDVRTRLEAFFQAFNDHDPEAILTLCAEDVVWEDPDVPEPLVGWEAVADQLVRQFSAFPDLHFPKEEIEIYRSLDGRKAASRWHMVATMTGRLDPPGYEPTGKTGDASGMCRFEFGDGGLITHHSIVYDTKSFAQRLGLMPGPDAFQSKTMVILQQAEQLGRSFFRNLHR